MRKQTASIIIILMSLLSLSMHAQTYDTMWKRVEALQKKDLPESVIRETQKIYNKAEKEQNVPQMMKAFLTAAQSRAEISEDSLKVDKKKLLNWAEKNTNIADRSVLYIIWSELSMNENIKDSFDKLMFPLKHKDELKQINAATYKPLEEDGKTSAYFFGNNLYDLLARQAIGLLKDAQWQSVNGGNQTEQLPKNIHSVKDFMSTDIPMQSDGDVKAGILHIYQSLLNLYNNENDRSAWLLTALETQEYLCSEYSSFMTKEQIYAQYKDWIKEYSSIATVPEVYIAYCSNRQFREESPVACLALAREGIQKYPDYMNINQLKNVEKDILNPNLSIHVDVPYPEEIQKLNIEYKNLTGATMLTYRINLMPDSPILWKQEKEILRFAKLEKKEHITLESTNDYKPHTATFDYQMPKCGIYYLKVIPDGNKKMEIDGTLIYVSSLRIIFRPLPDKEEELVVVDAKSGHPVKDAIISTYKHQYEEGFIHIKDYQTDINGSARISGFDNRLLFYAHRKNDEWMKINSEWIGRFNLPETNARRNALQLFIDRSLYRPGQTVYVSGVFYTQLKDETSVLPDETITLTLRDANYKEIGKKEVKTNEFGSFNHQFVLPEGGLNGHFSIQATTDNAKGSVSFNVEEYKRPTFEVTFEKIQSQFQANDSILINGLAKTYTGVPVTHAKVHYKIERRKPYFRFWNSYGETASWEGNTDTDDNGQFSIPVKLQVSDSKTNYFYDDFHIIADVTSNGGETQQGNTHIPVGSTSMVIDIDGIKEEMYKEKLPKNMAFSAKNLMDEQVDANIHYKLIQLEKQENKKEPYKEVKVILQGEYAANKPFDLENLPSISSGMYRVSIFAKDDKNRDCKAEKDFLILSLKDKKLPIERTDWFYIDGKEFGTPNPTVYIGTTEKDVYLLYDVFSRNKHLESKRINISDEIIQFTYPYSEEYGDGILVSWAFVKNDRLYNHQSAIVRPRPDKELHLKWTSFRDKLTPGQKEEWRLTIVRPNGKAANAELLAMMYDASLDQMKSYNLSFYPGFNRPIPQTSWQLKNTEGGSMYVSFPYTTLNYPGLDYSRLNIFMHMYFEPYNLIDRLNKPMTHRADVVFLTGASMKTAASRAVEESEEAVQTNDEAAGEQNSPVQVRENFQETAFFYPQLRTNEKGEVSIVFILPESLTKWNFVGFAHTKEVDYGFLRSSVTANKDFMIQANMPRFVRSGDEVHVVSQLINLTNEVVKGDVKMELFNPQTDKVFYSDHQSFSVDGNKNAPIDFSFKVTDEYPIMAIRFIADGGKFSDGEQHYLPVLTDKEWVTETVPLYINGAGKKTFSLDTLFNRHSNTATGKKLTVELTANPAWYAVQALPALSNPENESVISWAVTYYSNAIAKYISDTHPRIRQVIESWKAQGGNKESFMSQLQKNQELKNMMLEETPWIMEAESEAEQRNRIATLFDINTMSNRLLTGEQKLQQLQKPDGGWSWFEGMAGNRYITTEVMKILMRLQDMTHTTYTGSMKLVTDKAMKYLKEQATKEYQEMLTWDKKHPKSDNMPSESVISYLYIQRLYDKTAHATSDKMTKYFLDKIASHPTMFTIYGKAIGSVVLYDYGRTDKAKEFLQSLMEYSVSTDEMGRYYDARKADYSWYSYRIPTEVAAIEAVNRITKDQHVIDDMQRWLLKQKQTQYWATPLASADAIYALLNIGEHDLLAHPEGVKIKIGESIIQAPKENVLGYVKERIPEKDKGATSVTIEKESDGTSWGAVYAQYFEDMDKVQSQGNALTIRRELLKGKDIIHSNELLHVRDKVTIRLTVSADRDMDFVQIKDQRAACMEPLDVISGYRWNNGLGVYQSTKDSSTMFYADKMRKGTYQLEYQVYITRTGKYLSGIATVQSAYAPEFAGHGTGMTLIIK
ncbi:alpha-2-macroglobulin family protein [Phocaeicola oris]|uniref:alpha-2-macroglobulin family protein n=1 Tax=Phocaeicola oris TaxID=2896850 RepID=UPI00234F48FC|nr:alpha-2-macroglobulin family protein [Phocaeicola oris]MCE2615877.1 alpha-2-macroglobulin [Phocaeicola oris]